jgi:hypothetical protein
MARRHLHFSTKAASFVLRSGLQFIRASIGRGFTGYGGESVRHPSFDQELLFIACAAVRLGQSFIGAVQ